MLTKMLSVAFKSHLKFNSFGLQRLINVTIMGIFLFLKHLVISYSKLVLDQSVGARKERNIFIYTQTGEAAG